MNKKTQNKQKNAITFVNQILKIIVLKANPVLILQPFIESLVRERLRVNLWQMSRFSINLLIINFFLINQYSFPDYDKFK